MNHGIVGYGNSTNNAKANDTTQSLHIGLNIINLCMFIWQIPMGLEIVLKVFKFLMYQIIG
jgi:hypothetical protein